MNKVFGLILASGTGERAALNKPKQFFEVKGKMLIEHSIEAFENNSFITVTRKWKNGDTAKFQAAISGYALVGGGNEDGVKAKVTMRINGDVTFTDAS